MSKSSHCEIYLVRHGQTKWNAEGLLQGQRDEPLNEQGEKQARQLKETLKDISFSAIYSSDLSRAIQTGIIIMDGKNIALKRTSSLRERFMGRWEGRTRGELDQWMKQKEIWFSKASKQEFFSYKWEDNVESYADIYGRFHMFIQNHAPFHLGSTILLSSHGGVLKSLLYHFDFHCEYRWSVPNCSFIKLTIDQEGKLSLMDKVGIEKVKADSSLPF
jgi:probable phosphoglycerate mutase